jgi:hypothetical protein
MPRFTNRGLFSGDPQPPRRRPRPTFRPGVRRQLVRRPQHHLGGRGNPFGAGRSKARRYCRKHSYLGIFKGEHPLVRDDSADCPACEEERRRADLIDRIVRRDSNHPAVRQEQQPWDDAERGRG